MLQAEGAACLLRPLPAQALLLLLLRHKASNAAAIRCKTFKRLGC
jgi:hypothetical protein